MRNLSVVTTSWDDGDPKDLKIAGLLSSRNIPGTFYVPTNGYRGRRTLAAEDLKRLSSDGFELGGHTVTHNSLPGLSPEQLEGEVHTCKDNLEQVLGKRVSMFCYPNGRYDAEVVQQVRKAGYEGARTTRMLSVTTQFRPFEMPTTLHAYPHRRADYMKNLARSGNVKGLLTYTTKLSRFDTWIELGKHMFSQVLEYGGIWHLYGHSWEIDELGLWTEVSEMLNHVANRNGVNYVTNGQLISLLKNRNCQRSEERQL